MALESGLEGIQEYLYLCYLKVALESGLKGIQGSHYFMAQTIPFGYCLWEKDIPDVTGVSSIDLHMPDSLDRFNDTVQNTS